MRLKTRTVSNTLQQQQQPQMAGDSGERKRLPKRPSSGHRAEKASGGVTETDKVQARPVSCADRGGRKERRGKENSAGSKASASARPNPEKPEDAESCCGSADRADPGLVFDEDSNHIFPVEQFFGNLDAVQVMLFTPPWGHVRSRLVIAACVCFGRRPLYFCSCCYCSQYNSVVCIRTMICSGLE